MRTFKPQTETLHGFRGSPFDLDKIDVDTIRDDADYPGLRAKVTGTLATAMIRFHIDINIGDPLWPDPQPVKLPRLLSPTPLAISGYSAELVLAEKIVTALQRGTANTRWRDFVDIAALAPTNIDTGTLAESITRVAQHRATPIATLAEALDGYADLAQSKWAAWRRKQRLADTPSEFADLLTDVVTFADPILSRLKSS
ncbi:MAG: nucleotidyl transferase AbiEii/AbiGii toxin family protein [bacterium]|nr:nucleotidyl transferase AbiEii/AbiGii toxin family protein [bacterium]